MKTKSKLGGSLLATLFGLVVAFVLAEILSIFFLPKPHENKLPLIRAQADKECGYIHQPNQTGYSLEGKVTINQWGFRGRDWTVEKPENTKRIAVVGDSYVYGHGVHDEEVFGARLEEIMNEESPHAGAYEVLNFSASGYDLGHEINVIKKYALQFKPDVVILHFFMNDLMYIDDYSFYPELFRKREAEFSPTRWRLRELGRKSRIVMALWDYRRSLAIDAMSDPYNVYTQGKVKPMLGPATDGWLFVIEKLKEFKTLADQYHFKPIFVVIPAPSEIFEKEVDVPYVNFLRSHSQYLNISFLALHETFQESHRRPRDLMLAYDSHFSPEAHIMVARALAKKLVNR